MKFTPVARVLKIRGKEESNVCPVSTMSDLLKMVENSDKSFSFWLIMKTILCELWIYAFWRFRLIFMFVFWGIIIRAIIALIRGSFGRGHMCGHDHGDDAHGKDKSPLEILKRTICKR